MNECKLSKLQNKPNLKNTDIKNYYKAKFKNLRNINYAIKKKYKEIYQTKKISIKSKCNENYGNYIKLN